jgi:antagonist of KipI
MGLRLAGAPVSVLGLPDRLSRPVTPGTIQVAGGQLLVLGVGCGTMGGYPQVAQVISVDLARVGQLREGDLVRFRRIGLDEARALDREKRERMRALGSRLTALANDAPPSLAPH